MPLSQIQVGPQAIADGAQPIARAGRTGEAMVSELHGRFYEQNFRGLVFSGGMGLTSISNVTFTTGTLGATCTPIAGVWNPSTSPVNLIILQASISVIVTAATSTGGAPFAWASSVGNTAISTGSVPLNRKSLVKAGSYAKDMCGIALTGQTNALVVMGSSALCGGSLGGYSQVDTAVGFSPAHTASVENVDGSWIVPPGGLLALLATTTPVAHSAAAMILWEEVPI